MKTVLQIELENISSANAILALALLMDGRPTIDELRDTIFPALNELFLNLEIDLRLLEERHDINDELDYLLLDKTSASSLLVMLINKMGFLLKSESVESESSVEL